VDPAGWFVGSVLAGSAEEGVQNGVELRSYDPEDALHGDVKQHQSDLEAVPRIVVS
jgi:hypothetical protein